MEDALVGGIAQGEHVGFDGDESCEVSVAVNAHHRFTQAQKKLLGLEARDRVGGRVWTERLADGTPIRACTTLVADAMEIVTDERH